ncbi:unnamed protein product [Effrenium voratum]|nr:unnamed protein product [Effrenium voratum]
MTLGIHLSARGVHVRSESGRTQNVELCPRKLPFESEAAKRLNQDIFETIYFAACEASCELAEVQGPYETYEGSPASQGRLQFDLWGVEPSARWDWAGLKARIARSGLRNSLLVAPMPTASTAQILGNNESFEPYTQNLYVRRVLSGEFVQVNRHLLRDLIQRGLWSEELRVQLIRHNGSVQALDIPDDLKDTANIHAVHAALRTKSLIPVNEGLLLKPTSCQRVCLNEWFAKSRE